MEESPANFVKRIVLEMMSNNGNDPKREEKKERKRQKMRGGGVIVALAQRMEGEMEMTSSH